MRSYFLISDLNPSIKYKGRAKTHTQPLPLPYTLSSQKKKKMATNRKRESCQLLPLSGLPWWSAAYASGGTVITLQWSANSCQGIHYGCVGVLFVCARVPALWKGSLVLKTVVKKPNGNAPIPKDMWKPVSPNPWKGCKKRKEGNSGLSLQIEWTHKITK